MINKFPFLYFILTQLLVNRSKHIAIFIISTLLIALISSFLFISNSIQKDLSLVINSQASFIVQKTKAGRVVDTPLEWVDEFLGYTGVQKAIPRVYGRYYYEPNEEYFTIIGIDLYDTQILNSLKKISNSLDIDEFLSKDYMIVGDGVKKFLDKYEYFKYYTFRTPKREIQKVYLYNKFKASTSIVSSDVIVMNIDTAKKILGIDEEYCTDILLDIPNHNEQETIKYKIIIDHFDSRIISKDDLQRAYINFYNYKSTVFIVLYIFVLITFILILYQRYTYINNIEKKDIATLRTIGWSIKKVIALKLAENSIVFVGAYILGVNLAYSYVYILKAPLLANIFLGYQNLSIDVNFTPYLDFSILVTIFLLFILPILASILFPIWKISTTQPLEALR